MKVINSVEGMITNKVLANKIREIEKEIAEKNKILTTLTAEKNVLIFEYDALKKIFEELTGSKWDII